MSPAAAARLKGMSSVTGQISISLDGFVARPNQSLEKPDRRGRDAPARVGVQDAELARAAGVAGRRGQRLEQNVGDPTLEPVEVVASPAVTHVRYRVVR